MYRLGSSSNYGLIHTGSFSFACDFMGTILRDHGADVCRAQLGVWFHLFSTDSAIVEWRSTSYIIPSWGMAWDFSIVGFCVTLDLYFDDFLATIEFSSLLQNIHQSTSLYWSEITEVFVSYNLSQFKAWCFSLAMLYIHAILTHTLTDRKEITIVVDTLEAYFYGTCGAISDWFSPMLS